MDEIETYRTKVHKITLLVVDHDDLGQEEAKDVLENQRYPNHCMYPQVMDIETVEVDWHDDHPLNFGNKTKEEFERLFGG